MSRFELPDPEEAMTDNCNVNICYFGDMLYAMTETSALRRIDPETLETIGYKVRLSFRTYFYTAFQTTIQFIALLLLC